MEKVAIIGSVGYPSKYGGFETLVHYLVQELGNKVRFTIYCSSKNYPKSSRNKNKEGVRLVYLPFKANGIQSIIYDSLSMIHALFFARTFLILGVSGCFMLPFLRLFTTKKLIVNIDGMEWKRQKWNRYARIFLKWSEKMAVRFAHVVVTDNEAIKQYVISEYLSLSERIEYGADHVVKCHPKASDYKKYPFLSNAYAFKVARIEPENNIDLVLEAFSESTHQLVIVGNWDHSSYAKQLKNKYEKHTNIYLLDPIYDQEKLDVLRSNCWLYVHGHSAGGTNPSLVEAMYLGLPIIAFDVIYNKETTEFKAEYFDSVESLKKLIAELKYYELMQIAGSMKEIALRRYRWSVIGNRYYRLFVLSKKVLTDNKKLQIINRKEYKFLKSNDAYHLMNKHYYFEELD